jgi:hypothetical protein
VELHWNLRKTTEPWRNGGCQDNLLPWLKAKSPICLDLSGLTWWEGLLERIKAKFKETKEDTSRKITFFQKCDTNKQNMTWKIIKCNNPFVVYSVVTFCTETYLTYTTKTWHQCYCKLQTANCKLQTVIKGKPVTGRKTKYIPSDTKLKSSVLVQGKEKLHALY